MLCRLCHMAAVVAEVYKVDVMFGTQSQSHKMFVVHCCSMFMQILKRSKQGKHVVLILVSLAPLEQGLHVSVYSISVL